MSGPPGDILPPPAPPPAPPPDPDSWSFRSTLAKVMAVQVVTLIALWLLQLLFTR